MVAAAAPRWSPAPARAGRPTSALAGVEPVVLPGPARVLGALWTFRDDAVRHAVPDAPRDRGRVRLAVDRSAIVAAVGHGPRRRASGAPSSRCWSTSQTIPIVALAPLFVLWFGFGLRPRSLVVVLVTFFPIVVSLLDGFRSASAGGRPTCCAPTARPTAQAFRKLRWPVGAAVVLHRAADRGRVRGDRRGVRGVRRGDARASGSGCSSARTRSGPTSCSRRSSSRALVSLALYALVAVAERVLDPVVAPGAGKRRGRAGWLDHKPVGVQPMHRARNDRSIGPPEHASPRRPVPFRASDAENGGGEAQPGRDTAVWTSRFVVSRTGCMPKPRRAISARAPRQGRRPSGTRRRPGASPSPGRRSSARHHHGRSARRSPGSRRHR